MAEFLTTRGISYQLELLIDQAVAQITLISPYLKIPSGLLDRLKAAERRGVQIRLVYGKRELKDAEWDRLLGLKKLTVSFAEHLHAKCYANERTVIISSMNLYDFSERMNVEMGVLLTAGDGEAFRKAQEEVGRVVDASVREHPMGGVRATLTSFFQRATLSPQSGNPRKRSGYCIRCESEIPYRPQSPLCEVCYQSWAAWRNEDYPERNCHRCGKSADVSKAKPLCYACFRAEPFTPAAFA